MFNRLKYSMRAQLTLLFVLVSVIPMLAIGAASLRLFSQSLEDNGVRESATYLEFLDDRMGRIMADIHKQVLLAAYDDSIVSFCEGDRADPEQALYASRRLIRLQAMEKAHSVMLVFEDGSAMRYANSDYPNARIIENAGLAPIDPSIFKIYDRWAEPAVRNGERVVPYERLVLGDGGARPIARLIVNYPESKFAALYEDYLSAHPADFFIVNSQGVITSSSDASAFGQDAFRALGLPPDYAASSAGRFHTDGYVYTHRSNARYGYTLMERTPMSYYSGMFRPVLTLLLMLSLASILLALTLGAIMSGAFTKPIRNLIGRMRRDKGSIGISNGDEPRNEIAILNRGYDSIITQLETAIAQYYEEQRMKKEAQLRALEFQINPHFLYNTLSTIIWLIDAGEDERAIEITQELSTFFRISISKGRDYIPLKDELLHVKLYIDIQKARYKDKIIVAYDAPEELLSLLTPKLVLQPLVENSIIHAMQKHRDRTCSIRISAARDGENVWLVVEDDGEALTEEGAAAMNAFLIDRGAQDANFGIGISNVHDRIRLSFGEGYGLSFARVDGWTRATLRIRAMSEEGG